MTRCQARMAMPTWKPSISNKTKHCIDRRFSPAAFSTQPHHDERRRSSPAMSPSLLPLPLKSLSSISRCRLPLGVRAKSSLSQAEKAFADTSSAAFLAAAGKLDSIPNLNGLPEVQHTISSRNGIRACLLMCGGHYHRTRKCGQVDAVQCRVRAEGLVAHEFQGCKHSLPPSLV